MKRILTLSLAACMLLAPLAAEVRAAVNVERSGSENPMQEVAKSVIYGGLAGLILGGAVALANDGKNTGGILRWSFVGGTFFGFGYGLYHVSTRPRAMLEIEQGEIHLGALAPVVEPGAGASLSLVSVRF